MRDIPEVLPTPRGQREPVFFRIWGNHPVSRALQTLGGFWKALG